MADKPQNEGQVSVTNAGGAYSDEGTGAYEGPPAEVTYESAVSPDPTGAVEGPPAEVTVTSPAGEEVTTSTGAVEGPPAEVTTTQWPYGAETKAVTGSEGGVENKGVSSALTKDELLAEAERRGVDVTSSNTKAEIIEALGG